MNIIIFAAIIWGICKLISAASRKAKADRAERERERIREEQAAQREEMRLMRERAKAETRRQIEAEKARIAWQKRQDAINRQAQAERERLRKEQERQADEIAKLRHTIDQAQFDIDYLLERIGSIDTQTDYYIYLQSATVPGGDEWCKYQRRIDTLKAQAHAAETRLSKARFNKAQAQRKLA